MGDRANCVVKQQLYKCEGEIYLYTHWNGSGLLQTVQAAIQRRLRWDDPTYLTRIIFDQMTAGQQGQETGFGIGVGHPSDNSHDYVVVDVSAQEVRLEDPSSRAVNQRWSFKDFCSADVSNISY